MSSTTPRLLAAKKKAEELLYDLRRLGGSTMQILRVEARLKEIREMLRRE